MKTFAILLLVFFNIFTHPTTFGQTGFENTIKSNRLQYNEIEWMQYPASFGNIFFQRGADSVCRFIVENLEFVSRVIDLKAGFKLRHSVNVIIYPSATLLYESNVGVIQNNTNNTYPTVILEKRPRIVLAFNGSYEQLKADLARALFMVSWNEEIERSKVSINSPSANPLLTWIKYGATSYFSSEFSIHDYEKLYNITKSCPDFEKFKSLVNSQYSDTAVALSKGFCWYLECYYKFGTVKQWISALKLKDDPKTALKLVTKRDWEHNIKLYYSFLQFAFRFNLMSPVAPTIAHTNKEFNNTNWIQLANTGTSYRIELYGRKKSVIVKYGEKAKNLITYECPEWLSEKLENYPLVNHWNNKLFIILPIKGKLWALIYSHAGKLERKIKIPEKINGVMNFAAIDESNLILSAHNNQQSDIVQFNIRTFKIQSITNDLADNILIAQIANDSTIYHSGFPKNPLSEKYPQLLTSKQNGLYSKLSVAPYEEILVSSTTYQTDYNYGDSSLNNGSFHLPYQSHWIEYNKARQIFDDSLVNRITRSSSDTSQKSILSSILPENYKSPEGSHNPFEHTPRLAKKYRHSFNRIWMSPSLNNKNFINRLQPYGVQFGIFKTPDIGALMLGGYSDIFENIEFNIGYKLPTNERGSDFFLRYKNRKKLVDWFIVYFRKVENLQQDKMSDWQNEKGERYPSLAKVKTNFVQLELRMPIKYRETFSLTNTIRADKTVFLTTDRHTLTFPNLNGRSNITTLSYMFNTIGPSKWNNNFLRGIMTHTTIDGVVLLNKEKTFSIGLGQEIGIHTPLKEWMVWYNRIQMGYSAGGGFIRYTFGGQNQPINTRVDSTNIPKQNSPYIYQHLVNPLRGFAMNTMAGNLYSIYNSELFFQLFDNGIFRIKSKFNFLNSLQLGLFVDIAYAKESFEENLWERRNCLGISSRTTITNYPIRIDLAFPYSLRNKPMIHVSLTL